MLDRRSLLAAIASTSISNSLGSTRTDLIADAAEAWTFGLPLIETANVRASLSRRTAPNTLFHYRKLVTPRSQTVTTPNVDTLYSTAWLDLSGGPLSLAIPSFGKRYLSVALMDTYTNNFALFGTRTTGDQPIHLRVAGPSDAGRDMVRSPTSWVWLLIRAEVGPGEDLGAFHDLQDRCRIDGPPSRRLGAPGCAVDADPATVLATLAGLFAESPPSGAGSRVARALASLHLNGDNMHNWRDADLAQIRTGFDAAYAKIMREPAGIIGKGWLMPQTNMGNFGRDYHYRAQIALKGLAALPNREAMYFWGLAPDGGISFDSARQWRFTLPTGSLPVDGFWSLTAYELAPGGKNYLYENVLSRYALGSHQGDLVRGSDGSVTIRVQRDAPTDGPLANWLPAPHDEPFQLVLRAYLPRQQLLNRSYAIPPVVGA